MCKAETQNKEGQRYQEKEDNQRGPLSLFQSPVETEEGNDDVIADKKEEKLGDYITEEIHKQKDAWPGHPTSEQYQHGEHHQIREQFIPCCWLDWDVTGGMIDGTGPTTGILIDRRPGKRATIANDIAIDEVSNASEDLSNRSKQNTSVKKNQGIHLLPGGTPDERGNHQENSSEEGHATFPGGNDMNGVQKIVGEKIRLLYDKIETTSNETSRDAPSRHILAQWL